ncbi:unnamed protein product, partial [marine sediment metagenome]
RGRKRDRFRETFCAAAPEKVDSRFVERFRRCVKEVEAFIERCQEEHERNEAPR